MQLQKSFRLWALNIALFVATVWSLEPAHASAIKRIGLHPTNDKVHAITVAPGSSCSIKLPQKYLNVLLGNPKKFKVVGVSDALVSIKPLTDELGLFTSLQIVMDDQRILSVHVKTGPLSKTTSQLTFFYEGSSPEAKELEKKKVELESTFKEKAQNLTDTFKVTEESNYMSDLLYNYNYRSVRGGTIQHGIGVFPRALTVRENDRVFLKVFVDNRSSKPYRIANLQVMLRREGGFLWRSTKQEKLLLSNVICTKEDLVVAAKSKESCVVAFDRPKRDSKWTQIGLHLTEAATDSRDVLIRRILEIYS